jgi:hypothetical protein
MMPEMKGNIHRGLKTKQRRVECCYPRKQIAQIEKEESAIEA